MSALAPESGLQISVVACPLRPKADTPADCEVRHRSRHSGVLSFVMIRCA